MWLETHHNIPVSLRWTDNESNKRKLESKDHAKIHEKQNISSKYLRRIRMELNDTIVMTPRKLKMIHNAQRQYFDWARRLSPELIIPQTDSLTKMILYRWYQVNSILWQIEDNDKEYSIDQSRTKPPSKTATHKEALDECRQKLEMLFSVEQVKAKAVIEYIKKEYKI